MIAKLNEDGSFSDIRPSVIVSQVRYGDQVLFTSNSGLTYVYDTKAKKFCNLG